MSTQCTVNSEEAIPQTKADNLNWNPSGLSKNTGARDKDDEITKIKPLWIFI